jgi:hypothetical protein
MGIELESLHAANRKQRVRHTPPETPHDVWAAGVIERASEQRGMNMGGPSAAPVERW